MNNKDVIVEVTRPPVITTASGARNSFPGALAPRINGIRASPVTIEVIRTGTTLSLVE